MTVIAANVGRYPISAQCEILGVSSSTYYAMRGKDAREPAPDPAADDVVEAYELGHRRYGARKKKAALARKSITLDRRRTARVMKEKGLTSAYAKTGFKPHSAKVNEVALPNIVGREFDGHAPHTHIMGDLVYVCVGAGWNCVCLLIDLYNCDIVGHAASAHKDARLVKSAFATLDFSLGDIEVFHADRGSEFDSMAIDKLLDAFCIMRSLPKKGCPYDSAVDEPTNKILKAEFGYRESFSTLHELPVKLSEYVH